METRMVRSTGRPAARSGHPGELIARLLAGAWRSVSPPLDLSAGDLLAVESVIHRTGAGALAWWRLRDTRLRDAPVVEGFRQAYRLHALDAAVHALRTVESLARLEAAGVESLLVKGWAIARHYPEVGLRQYTDLDLIVRPGQIHAARTALAGPPALGYPVDLHDGPTSLDRLDFDALAARAEAARLGSRTVRVLAPEDHLRVLALHALRHGVFRPIWLVDLAVAVEGRPAGFDWERCLGPDRRAAHWVACTLALAHRLLGARVEGTPAQGSVGALPGWLVRAALRNWADGEGRSHLQPVFRALAARLGHPGRLWAEARRRWHRPIEATLEVGGPFNRLPRWPFQLAAVARRAPELRAALRDRTAARATHAGPLDLSIGGEGWDSGLAPPGQRHPEEQVPES